MIVPLLRRLLRTPSTDAMAANEGATPYLVVGLGNPGPAYALHRHNAGFMVVAELARRHDITVQRRQKQALVGQGVISGRQVILACPQTGMNGSGTSVRALRDWYHVPADRLLVVYDDLDLPLGTVRVRPSGSAGGHHGLESIVKETGTMAYPRVRLGIGRPASRADVIDFVLAPFHRDEQPAVEAAIGRAVLAVEAWLGEGLEPAIQTANGTGRPVE